MKLAHSAVEKFKKTFKNVTP